ncbi:VOC family protein [Aeromicrobium phragmitis]|uniref:VOC family protein n=1 Tax=Aeromicrobium phragmitis TaxID=2478914 RepID=A0A3L8PKJ5_9ACTN|nr:VOC family protein [Aeromicrobium phragmitis]RLV55714.1 VOC family protein [Aeromicrobium phragmitis]
MDQRLSLITLGVADLARARAFYENGLGFVKANDEPEVAFYQLPGIVLALWSRAELAADAGVTDTGARFCGIALAHNARTREEVDAILARAVGAGAVLTRAGESTPWGGYSGYFADPDGHLWEVAHNPFWTIHADGRTSIR